MAEQPKRTRTYLAEGITIVLSILLALFGEAQYDGYKKNKQLKETLQAVSEEISDNQANIEATLPMLRQARDLMQEKQNQGKTLVEAISEMNQELDQGQTPEHFLVTWDSAVNMGLVQDMDLALVRQLSRVEKLHQRQSTRFERMVELIYGSMTMDPAESRLQQRVFTSFLNDYISGQLELLEHYTSIKDAIAKS